MPQNQISQQEYRKENRHKMTCSAAIRSGLSAPDELRLVHTFAQARQWLEQLLSGEVSLRMIAPRWANANVM